MTEPKPLPDQRPAVAAKRGARARVVPAAKIVQTDSPKKDQPRSVFDTEDLLRTCPIVPLGMLGKVYYFLDVLGQMVWFDKKLDEGELTKLFGKKIGWLDRNFPSYNKDGEKVSGKFDQRLAQRWLIIACQDADIFDPADGERGRGSHLGDDGSLILHLGLKLMVAGARRSDGALIDPYIIEPGRIDDLIFARDKRMYARGTEPIDDECARVDQLRGLMIDHFDKWSWKGQRRVEMPEAYGWDVSCNIQAWLTLGWGMMALVCGAMPQRPSLFISGPSGGGKSSLHDALCAFIGKNWYIKGKDVTAAWITQQMKRARLAVLLDEKGAEGSNEDLLKRMLELVKVSYDGSGIGRGGADGKSTTNELYSACQLGGVFPPSNLKEEDRNRMIMLEIEAFPEGTKPYTQPKIYAELGPCARRRMVDHWYRFDAVLQAYRGAMMVRNFKAREANTYATALACADIALFDESPLIDSDRIAQLIHCITPMLTTSRAEGEAPAEIAIRNMLSVRVSAAQGAMQETMGQWIDKVIVGLVTDPYEAGKKSDAKLQSHGLRISCLGDDHEKGSGQGLGTRSQVHVNNWKEAWLVVGGRTHIGVGELFKSTDFSSGRWVTCFQRLRHVVCDSDGKEIGIVEPMTNKRVRIGGGKAGPCVMVPIAAVIDIDEVGKRIEAVLKDQSLLAEALLRSQ